MFDVIKEDWKLTNDKSQVSILEEITEQGNKLGEIYRSRCFDNFPCFDKFCVSNMLLHIIAFINFYTNDIALRYYFQLVCCHVCQDLHSFRCILYAWISSCHLMKLAIGNNYLD